MIQLRLYYFVHHAGKSRYMREHHMSAFLLGTMRDGQKRSICDDVSKKGVSMKRIAILLGLIILCTAMVSAGAQQEAVASKVPVTKPGMFPVVNTPVTLRAFVGMPAYVQDLRTNEFTLWYEEKSGVHIEWEVTPAEQALEKASREF